MKISKLLLLVVLVSLGVISCKKNIAPELEITVVNEQDEPIKGAWVEVAVDGADMSRLGEDILDSGRTDGFGKRFISFNNTVLVEVGIYEGASDNQTKLDSVSILLETRESTDDDNVYKVKLVNRLKKFNP